MDAMPFGCKVKDKMTGLTGSFTGIVEYYPTGRKQGLIEYLDSEGNPSAFWLDYERLEPVE